MHALWLSGAAPFPPEASLLPAVKVTWLTGLKGVCAAGDGAGSEQEMFKRRRRTGVFSVFAVIRSHEN